MVHFSASRFRIQCSGLHFARQLGSGAAIAGICAATALISTAPVLANDYEVCTRDLIDLGIEPALASAACSDTYKPVEVSNCVVNVTQSADVSTLTALEACARDRRPSEVATCVSQIHQGLAVTESAKVVELCHLSLLPTRYSECVVGLNAAGIEVAASLNECISAGYRPTDIAPSFIPVQ